MIDTEWFKQRHLAVGISQGAAAERLGRAPTFFTRVYSGQQRLRPDEAMQLAEILKVPVSEIRRRAGLAGAEAIPDGDAARWAPEDPEAGKAAAEMTAALAGGRAGVDTWRVSTSAMQLAGYVEGDIILVDTHRVAPAPGAVVLAQVYDWQLGSAMTLLRRYDPPVIMAASADAREWKPYVVDGTNVLIVGIVVASWREDRKAS